MAERCESTGNFVPGLKYTIRAIGQNRMNFSTAISHTFIQISTRDSVTNKPCFYSFGLKSGDLMNPNRPLSIVGTSYYGTILQEPDFAEMLCSKRVMACKKQEQIRSSNSIAGLRERPKSKCDSVCFMKGYSRSSTGEYFAMGHILAKGTLNKIQADIVNHLVLNGVKHKSKSSDTTWKVYKMPFTFSFFAACPSMDWKEQEYFNCQKFAILFHSNPWRIWQFMKPKDTEQSILDTLLANIITIIHRFYTKHDLQFETRNSANMLSCSFNISKDISEKILQASDSIPPDVIESIASIVAWVMLRKYTHTSISYSDVSINFTDDPNEPNWEEIVPAIISMSDCVDDSGQYADNEIRANIDIEKLRSMYPTEVGPLIEELQNSGRQNRQHQPSSRSQL